MLRIPQLFTQGGFRLCTHFIDLLHFTTEDIYYTSSTFLGISTTSAHPCTKRYALLLICDAGPQSEYLRATTLQLGYSKDHGRWLGQLAVELYFFLDFSLHLVLPEEVFGTLVSRIMNSSLSLWTTPPSCPSSLSLFPLL